MERTQVLIAGGGPVGAMAAFILARAGIDVTLLEMLSSCPEDMRASTLHPPTLDMLAELGVLDELEEQGLRAARYHYRNRKTGSIIEFDFSDLADISAHPYRLQCEQYKLARLLTAKLEAAKPGCIRFNHRVVGYEQDADGVTAFVETPIAIERIRADYLLGADGANSIVRKWTGVRFEGFTYPERFLTLSTRYPIERHFPGLAGVNYVADDDEWCVLLRVPDLWRVMVPTDIEVSSASLLSEANKDAIFDRLTGDGKAVETYHRTLYRVHQRVADSFHHGRVLLVGDAAHLNNPLGGFGMNSGIHDVWNLTTKLRDILLDGRKAEPALAHYDRQRRMIANSFVQAQTIANKRMLEIGDGEDGRSREQHMAEIADDPERRRAYLMRQSMYESLATEAAIN
jgi:3-(3-hydroxy-phenyl)propionate hydroxylase